MGSIGTILDAANPPSPPATTAILTALAVLATVPFWLTDLDIAVARLYFEPDHQDGPWPVGRQWPWTLLYRVAPVLSVALGLGALAVAVIGSRLAHRPELTRTALVTFLTLALGPGLLVNAVFKDHWGRPRPNHLVEFGGAWDYLPPLAKGEAGRGKSFPCGHASVGFAVAAVALGCWRRRPRVAVACWVGALGLGALLGVTRMAAGNHFVSDVLWAAVMTVGVACSLHWLITVRGRRSECAVSALARARPALPVLAALAGVSVVAAALFATPMYKEIRWSSAAVEQGGRHAVSVAIDRADVRLELVDAVGPRLEVDSVVQGFGLPGGDVRRGGELIPGNPAVLRYELASEGTFTDLDAAVRLRVAVHDLHALELRLDRGNITVVAPPGLQVPARFDVDTGDGSVIFPETDIDR